MNNQIINPFRTSNHPAFLQRTALAMLLLVAVSVPAANITWTGGGGTANWALGGNWSGINTPPITGDTPVFGTVGGGGATLNNDLAADTSFLGLTVETNAPSFTLNGNRIDSTGGILDKSLNSQTVGLDIIFASTHSLTALPGASMTINSVISGAGGATKNGGGTVTLKKANTYTGITAINNGSLNLDFTSGSPASNIVSALSVLSGGGGTLNLMGNASVASKQTFASGTFTPGLSVIHAAPVSGANNPTIELGALAFQLGSTVRFEGAATIDSAGSSVAATATITTTTAGAGGAAAPWGLIYGGGTPSTANNTPAFAGYATVGLNDWASTDLTDATAGTSPYVIIGGSQIPGFYVTTFPNASGNFDMTANTTLAAATRFANSIRFNTPAANVLTLNSIASGTPAILLCGGILVTPAMGAVNTIMQPTALATLGNWQIGRVTSPTGPQEGVIWQNNTLGYFQVNVPIPDGRDAGDVNHVVVAGPGTVVFGNVNGYSGQTYVNGGSLMISNNSCLGSITAGSAVNLSGGTLIGTSTFTLDNTGANKRAVNLLSGGGGLAAVAGTTLTISGVVGSAAGVGALTIGIKASNLNGNVVGQVIGSGDGTANTTPVLATGMVVLNGANFHTGGTVVESGTLNINGINALGGVNYGGLILKGSGLQYAAALSGNGSGDLSAGNSVTLASGACTIGVNGNSVAYANPIGGNGSLTVQSLLPNGVLDLQAANTYTGGTTIAGGTLRVNNTSGSGTGSGAVTASGGALGGNGIITGAVTIASSGILAPGNSVGKLTVRSLDLEAGATCNFEFNATPTNDQAIVTASGGLTLNGGLFNFYQEGTVFPVTALGTYQLIQFSGAIGGTGLDSTWTTASASNPHVGNPQSGYAYVFDVSGGWLRVTISANANIGTWGVDADGNWSSAGNWTGTFGTMPPRNANDSATLGVGTALRTVTLDANETVGGLTMNNSNSFVIGSAGKTLTMNASGSGAVVSITDGSNNVIQTAVALADNLTISANSTKKVTITSTVANSSGAKTLTLNGAGIVGLSGNNTYGPSAGTVGTTISGIGGTVELGHDNALAAGDVTMAGNTTFKVAKANLNLANSVAVGANVTATIDNNGNNANFAGAISGSGGLVKQSPGTLTLSSANSYQGSTVVNNGTVSISSDSGLGAVPGAATPNSLVLNGAGLLGNGTFSLEANRGIGLGLTSGSNGATAFLDAASGQLFTIVGAIASAGNTGSNNLVVNSGAGNNGIVALAGVNTHRGTTAISNGTLRVDNSLALQNSTLVYNVGQLDFGGQTDVTLGGLNSTRDIALDNTAVAPVALSVGNNGSSSTYVANFTGGGSLRKVGAGTLILTGTNTYAGSTTASGGVLQLNTNGVINNAAAANVSAVGGARLWVNGGTLSAASCNVGGGSLGLQVSGGSATYSGALTADNGSSSGWFMNIIGGSVSAASMSVGRSTTIFSTAPAAGATANGLYISNGVVNIAGNVLMGNSSAANSSVSARIDAGSLTIGGALVVGLNNAGRWSVMDVNGGTLTVNDTANGITLGSSQVGSQILLVRGGTTTAGTVHFGQADIAGTGVLNVSGGNLYIGSGGIASGSVNMAISNILTSGTIGATADWSSSLGMILAGNGTLRCADAANNPFNITLTGALTGTGGFTKSGNGILTLDLTADGAANTYTGNTTISAGVLSILDNAYPSNSAAVEVVAGAALDASALPSGLVVLNTNQTLRGGGTVLGSLLTIPESTVAPGSAGIGTLTVTNAATLAGTNVFEVSHIGSVVTNDQLVTPTLNISPSAQLIVQTVAGSTFAGGDTFKLFSHPVTGFASVTLPALDGGLYWTNKLAANGTIAIFSGVNQTPTNLSRTVSNGVISLDWPADHIGWRLQMQTNPITRGISTNWVDVPGSANTNHVELPTTDAPTKFFRMIY